ncbi:MAG: DUF3048 domain-containing protein [Oscillochloridaceae bacterium umkhey_bin13]
MTRTHLRAGALVLLLLALFVSITPAAAQPEARRPAPQQAALTIPRGSLTTRPYVVMYDNHPRAYPQAGMNQAPLVFEALAEFGITRYMAVFVPGVSAELRSIGPVRSARAYFVEYAKGLRGIYVHAGGSPDAITLARTSVELVDMDALTRNASSFFRRATDRAAPHNLYTSSANLAAFAKAQTGPTPDLSEIGFLYKTEAPLAQRPASQRLSYFFIYRESFVGWSYDPATNNYLYFRQRRPHVDAVTGAQLSFKNVVVLEVPERPVRGDAKGRIEQNVIGEGAARVFMDGQMVTATWRKGAGFAQLQLYGADGTELALNPGPTWIAAIPSLKNLTVEGER